MIKNTTCTFKFILISFIFFYYSTAFSETINVTPDENLAQIIWDASEGDTIILAEGTYIAQPTIYSPSDPVFHIIRPITIKSSGLAINTILKSNPSNDQVVKVHPTSYTTTSGQSFITNPSGASLHGVTIEGERAGILVRDFQNLAINRLNNIHLSQLILNLTAPSSGHGIELNQVDNSFLEGNVINNAYANGIYILESRYNILTNNTVKNTLTQHAIAIQGGFNNKVINNTVTGAAADGIILLYSNNNRIEHNNLQGFNVDGITATDGSHSNFIAFNTIISSGKQLGRDDGTGIWLNCSSNNNTVLGNSLSGSPENGLSIFSSSNNFISANKIFDNFDGGIFVWHNQDFCFNPDFPGEIPQFNFIKNNYSHFNVSNAMVNIRGGINSEIGFNFLSGLKHFNGDLAGDNTGGVTLQDTNNINVFGNTTASVNNAVFNFSDVQKAIFFQNRYFNSPFKYATFPATIAWDAGNIVGGNFWDNISVTGNPSNNQPFNDFIFDSIGNRGGIYLDNHPFADETLGQNTEINILSPDNNQIITNASVKLISWQAQGCIYVDLSLVQSNGSTSAIASNAPNTGSYLWDLSSISAGNYSISIACKNAIGQAIGTEDSVSNITVFNKSELALVSPGYGERLATGSLIRTSWTKSANTGNINIYLSVDNQEEVLLASNISGSYTDIQLPLTPSNNARLRITSTNNQSQDSTYGSFSIQNQTSTISSPSYISNWQSGQTTTIHWNSPFSSVRVNIDINNGSEWVSIVNNHPDTSQYTWIIKELIPTNSNHIRIQFFDINDQQLTDANSAIFSSNLLPCNTELSPSLFLTIPSILVGNDYFSAGLNYAPITDDLPSWTLNEAPNASTLAESCQPVKVSNNKLYIPKFTYNDLSYWADFLLSTENNEIRLNLNNFGLLQ